MIRAGRRLEEAAERAYQIGTVSHLTGLEPNTIRAWERRYGAIEPMRTETGRRRYDDETVERLQLLKALVECNESIGTIAHLPDGELRERLEKLAAHESHRSDGAAARQGSGPIRCALLAPALTRQLRANACDLPEIEETVVAAERGSFLEEARRRSCDVVLLELECLGDSPLGFVQTCRTLPGAPIVVILYRFARRETLARLSRSGAKIVQAPVRVAQLRRIILDHLTIERARSRVQPATPAPGLEGRSDAERLPERDSGVGRLFSDEQLTRLFEVSTAVECECPNHLSSLVAALAAFETYSRGCESRDEVDAALHRRLAVGTGEARLQLERLLRELCEHEGICV